MRADDHSRTLTRRQFMRTTAAGAGLLGLAAVNVPAATENGPIAGTKANPYAYDVSRLTRTDPSLIHYQQTHQMPVPHAEPRRLALGLEDQVYLAAGNYVTALDEQGLIVSEFALQAPVRCLAISAQGEIYVGLRDHIEVFDAKGQRRASWDSAGPRAWITGLTVAGQSVFAADAGNRLVLRYDRNGRLMRRIGEKNKERNIPGFIVPSPFFDVEMHPDGLLRVANPGRHRVEVYTADGDFELAWGRPSTGIDGFCGCCNPINLSLLPDGRVVTCEKGLPRVKVYGIDGGFESVVAGPESFPENVRACSGRADSDCTRGGLDSVADSKGRIYILDLVRADIRVMARKPDQPASSTTPAPRPS